MKTVFVDVDTQLDFLSPAGALYVPGAEGIEAALADLTRFAASRKITIVSTMDAHTEDDPEFRTWKPHCVVGTQGQQKNASTLLPGALDVLAPKLEGVPQILVPKQTIDPFSNSNLTPLFDRLAADRYIVYGLVTELCVARTLAGLLARGGEVHLVREATKALDAIAGQATFDSLLRRGGRVAAWPAA